MNRAYSLTAAVCIYISVMLPRITLAQCPCVGADTLTQHVIIDTSDAPKVVFSFQQYNDPTGVMGLTCLTIQDTISVVSSTMARNKSLGPVANADFFININTKITGPDIVGTPTTGSLTYGPINLGPYGTTILPSDSVVLGPDTIINKKAINASPSIATAYKGTGTVSDTLQFGGGGSSDAGTTFDYSIRTKYWGTALITFYLCPNAVLATAIKDFTATQNGNIISLQWLTDNEQNNTHYEIQVSTQGKKFVTAGQAEGDTSSGGLATKYQYQYNLDPANVGVLYFRIQRTDASGKISYSAILTVSPGDQQGNSGSYQTYPNPAINTLVFRFNTAQTGRYLMELINTAGQVIQRESTTLTGTNEIRMDLSPKPAKGLYFLRTTDITHDQRYSSKILIN